MKTLLVLEDEPSVMKLLRTEATQPNRSYHRSVVTILHG